VNNCADNLVYMLFVCWMLVFKSTFLFLFYLCHRSHCSKYYLIS